LVLETLRSANEFSAQCVNYVKAIGAEMSVQGKLQKVICEDQITKTKFSVQARHFVSTVGPWTDEVGTTFFKDWKKILRPTKGVHLTFEKKRLPMSSAVVMAAEKRIVFGIPRHEMVIVGTTDTDFQGSPSDVVATPDDVQYLLKVIETYFPGAGIQASDIISTYAGVRPLVADGSSTEGKTSREHTIFTEDHGVTFVAGGKYTTYRLMAEQIVKECLRFFPIEDKVRFNKCQTDQPVNPLVTIESRQDDHRLVDQLNKTGYLAPEETILLVDRHGAEARKIWQTHGPSSYWELEAHHAIQNTMCLHLVDFYTRRAPLFLAYADHGQSLISKISAVFASRYGWNREQIDVEERLLTNHMRHELAWRQKIV
ncbi:MAG: glycerol-3-phosphate dehydrogenase/oxidase, partial [Pseudobdellovibrionaceae bacterium]